MPKGKVLKKVRTRTPEQEAMLRQVRAYQSRMRMRVGVTNQIKAMLRQELIADDEADAMIAEIQKPMKSEEGKLMRRATKVLPSLPIWTTWLELVEGCGECLAFQLIAHIQPIGDFPTASHLWAYAGYKVDNKTGRAVVRKAGVQSNWNDELKVLGYQLVECFIKQRAPYRELYDSYKARKQAEHPEPVDSGRKNRKTGKPIMDYTKMHLHKMAIRYCFKIFLSHLWEVWRELEGLPVRGPYVIEYMGHQKLMSPWEFVKREEVAVAV